VVRIRLALIETCKHFLIKFLNISSLLLFLVRQISCNKIDTRQAKEQLHVDQTRKPNTCLCTNGGICILSNDLCVCQRGFTGRYCEIDMNVDKATRELYSCGSLKHQYSEYRRCSLCQCSFSLLTCKVKWNANCNSIQKRQLKTFRNKKLDYLQNLTTRLETLSYNEYLNNNYISNFSIRYLTDDDDNQMQNIFSLNKTVQDTSDNELIILKSNINPNKILGIYFKTKRSNHVISSAMPVLLCDMFFLYKVILFAFFVIWAL
jgi:hypothetical protein